METLQYFQKIQESLMDNLALWQATIIETEGSSPAKAGMKACIGMGELYFGNLGGGELEFGIITQIRQNQPDSTMIWSFSLDGSKLGEAGNDQIQTSMICGGTARVFIEPLHKSQNLYIIGAGHCGSALAHLARLTGFRTCLIDNREELLHRAQTEGLADSYFFSDYTDIRDLILSPSQAWVVIMTHGHLHDREVLEQCLSLNCRYLGMIGSKSKVAETFETLIQKGINPNDLSRVHAPIGLPIGSQSPFEIAVSIMAEIISLLRTKL